MFCVTQVVGLLHGHVDAGSLGKATLVFWLVWWAWTQFTWALNAANCEHTYVQMVTMLATAVAFFLAVGIPQAIGDSALWFAVPYVAVRTVGLLLYYWVASADRDQKSAVMVFGSLSVTGLVAVLAGAALGGPAQFWFWGGAIGLDLVAARVGGQREGWNIHPDHFCERHGLIVIIALGETLIVAAAGLADAPRDADAIATAVLTVAVTGGLWWSYFGHARRTFEHALAHAKGKTRSEMARDMFSVLHFPMLCGVIVMSAATEEALAHPHEPLTFGARTALAAGAALFVVGGAAAIWRATGAVLVWRVLLAPVLAIAVVVAGGAPWQSMSLVFVMLVAIAVAERRLTAAA